VSLLFKVIEQSSYLYHICWISKSILFPLGLGKGAGLVKAAVQVNVVQKLVRLGKTLGEKQSATEVIMAI